MVFWGPQNHVTSCTFLTRLVLSLRFWLFLTVIAFEDITTESLRRSQSPLLTIQQKVLVHSGLQEIKTGKGCQCPVHASPSMSAQRTYIDSNSFLSLTLGFALGHYLLIHKYFLECYQAPGAHPGRGYIQHTSFCITDVSGILQSFLSTDDDLYVLPGLLYILHGYYVVLL